MYCCVNCFRDPDVIGFIQTNSTQIGSCSFCGMQDTAIISALELYDMFEELLLSYAVIEDEEELADNARLLHEHLRMWNIFKLVEDDEIKKLTQAIGEPLYKEQPRLFEQLVAPKIFTVAEYKQQVQDYILTWNKFKDEIRNTNRFFIQNTLDFEALKSIFASYSRSYPKNKSFFRARASDKLGLEKEKMGRPPGILATPGRANPKGISYLYLANDIKTTLYEVRASIYDYVTVAEFLLKEEINLISLRHSERWSPFQLDDINKYLLYEQFVMSLHNDLKKPLRRQDSELEYLPTQYLCELIKSLGYDGVEYGSSMNPQGFNIALFSDAKVECISSTVYEVSSITYDFNEII